MTNSDQLPRTLRLLRVLTHPPRSPLLQLAIYYVVVVLLGAGLGWLFPVVREVIAGLPTVDARESEVLRGLLDSSVSGRPAFLTFDLKMAIVMVGTLLVTIPFSWGYMSIREHAGYEQSVVQTLVVLPIVVAGIMMIVQFSLALAFALGGVAAAVRFRNTLKDVADAVYVFLAIGIGIAAGTGTLSAALVMSSLFTFTSVLLWRCNYGKCDLADHAERVASERRAQRTATRRTSKRRGDMTIELSDPSARAQVESILDARTRRWQLSQSTSRDGGAAVLQYQLRLKRSVPLAEVAADVRERLGALVSQVGITRQGMDAPAH